MRDVGDADTVPSLSGLGDTVAGDTLASTGPPPSPIEQRGELIGRFVVLEVLGSGGMGMVYAAYDPNLDRKVAIKVLGNEAMPTEEARVRMLREAQAMARIDHPNVLRVHEAGSLGDGIYIAMEFVGGGTLRNWLAGGRRTSNEIITAFLQAGRGLAAAHTAGLVHRDFKPDNVLMASDGVRVTDFGIVGTVGGEQAPVRPSNLDNTLSDTTPLSQDLTRTGALMGTPAYMAPEQFRGGLVGPAADQFAFCVALFEALYRTRPFAGETFGDLWANVSDGIIRPAPRDTDVPTRIHRALLRGLSTDAHKRFASMDALLTELVPGEGGNRKRMLAVAAAATLGVGALAYFALRPDEGVCTGAPARFAVAWGPAQRAKLAQAFEAVHRPDAHGVLDRVVPIVDRWGATWQQAYVGACEDTHVRRIQSEHLLDLRMQCLTRRLDEARATIEVLGAGGGDAVDHALEAVRALPDVSPCAGPAEMPAQTAATNAIHGKLVQARAQSKLGRYPAAVALAREAIDAARKANDQPALADATLELGTLQLKLRERAAVDTLGEAMVIATSLGDGELALRAAAGRISALTAEPGRHALGDELAKLANATAAHAPPSVATRVELENATALLLAEEGHHKEAQARYEHALVVATTQLGPDAPLTLATLRKMGTLAAASHHYDDARRLFEQVLAAEQRIAGPDHPDYAAALENVANAVAEQGKIGDSKQMRERALAIRLAALGPEHPMVGAAYGGLAGFYEMTGDYPTAKGFFEKQLAIYRKAYGEDSFENATPLSNYGYLQTIMGDHAGARQSLERSRALTEKAYGADDPRVSETLNKLGVLAREEKRYDDALALFKRSQQLNERAFGSNDPDVVDAIGEQATTYKYAGKLAEARELNSRMLSAIASVYGPQHERMGVGLGNYGFLQLELKDPEGALASFRGATQIFEAQVGKNHPNVGFTLIGSAQALIRLHREAEAVPDLERAIAICTAAHVAPGQVAEAHYYLAMALAVDPKQRARARAEANTALAGYQKAHNTVDAERVQKWLRKH